MDTSDRDDIIMDLADLDLPLGVCVIMALGVCVAAIIVLTFVSVFVNI